MIDERVNNEENNVKKHADSLIDEVKDYAILHLKRINNAFRAQITCIGDFFFDLLIGGECRQCFKTSRGKAIKCFYDFASVGTRSALLLSLIMLSIAYAGLHRFNIEEAVEKLAIEFTTRFHSEWTKWRDTNCPDKRGH